MARKKTAVMVSLGVLTALRALAATGTLPVTARIVKAAGMTVKPASPFGMPAGLSPEALAALEPAAGGADVVQAGEIQMPGEAFPVTLSVDAPIVKLSGGGTVADFRIGMARASQITVTPGPDLNLSLPVSAVLEERPARVAGTYTGSNRVFASYQ